MSQNNITENVVEEYKSYISNVLRNSFDFNTWFQHQYGKVPTGDVDPSLHFKVLPDENSHK